MGSGASGLAGGGGGTPSGVTYKQFMQMSEDERFDTINNIVNDPSIKVPSVLDDSDTTKVLYALGMNNKPTVVDDVAFDSVAGKEIYRTVYEQGSMPPPSSDDITDQIRNGDYTQMSGAGGSVHGRALYFATNFYDSASYGDGEQNSMIMRAKISPNAKIIKETTLESQMDSKVSSSAQKMFNSVNKYSDQKALYAISQGIDGWYRGTYMMMVNRGVLTASSKNKRILKVNKAGKQTGRISDYATSWSEGADV